MPDEPRPAGSVFLSYASQDAAAAERICDALRAAGVQVWLDKSELRSGDAWDAQIKKRIQECALFIPVISAHTNARSEGYFRGEWNLAIRRLMNMAQDAAFLVPVVIDDTREANARVPEEFLQAQWTWLPGGETSAEFAQRVRVLSERGFPATRSVGAPPAREHSPTVPKKRSAVIGAALAATLLILGAGAWWYLNGAREKPAPQTTNNFAPPPHSVAVLAFLNLSGDPKDEYFSDGLSEELLNTLVRIEKLRVAARTSSFSFKGKSVDIPTVGRQLNVGAVLEGSVRKVGEKVRITAQLIDAITGYHLWSQNFDREFKDIIALQSEIAMAVAGALEIKLLANAKDVQTPGGTQNPKALDAFLRGRAGERIQDLKNLRLALAALDEAVALDPDFANALAFRGDVLAQIAVSAPGDAEEVRRQVEDAQRSVRRAAAMAPDSGFVFRYLGRVLLNTTSDYAAIDAALRRAMLLEPGKAEALIGYSNFAVLMGRADALPAIERAKALDPLSKSVLANLGMAQYYSRRYADARASLLEAKKGWDNDVTLDWLALTELADGKPAAALPYCERDLTTWSNQVCLAVAYQMLGRQKDANAMLKKLQDELGDGAAYQYAQIHAQWGRQAEAMKWLEKAVELDDPGLSSLKVDPMLDPLRKIGRFQEIVAGQNFPA